MGPRVVFKDEPTALALQIDWYCFGSKTCSQQWRRSSYVRSNAVRSLAVSHTHSEMSAGSIVSV